MIPLNQIGPHQFVELSGNPDAIKQQLELVMRPGVNGVGAWKTGFRGRPFRLRARRDVANKAAGRTLYLQCRALVGADPVPLVWSNLDLEAGEAIRVLVLDVTQVDLRTLGAATGGLVGGQAWVELDFDLVAIAAA